MKHAIKIAAVYWLLSQALGLLILAAFVVVFLLRG